MPEETPTTDQSPVSSSDGPVSNEFAELFNSPEPTPSTDAPALDAAKGSKPDAPAVDDVEPPKPTDPAFPARPTPPKPAFAYASEEEKELFSKMSNAARNKLLPEWRKLQAGEYVPAATLKTLETKLAEAEERGKLGRWYDHPESYVLSDDYQLLAKQVDASSTILDYYRDVLAAIDAGAKDFQTAADNGKGEVVQSSERYLGNSKGKAYIQAEMAKYSAAYQAGQGRLETFKQTYSGRFKPVNEAISAVDAQVFKPLMSVPQFKAQYEQELARYPKEFQGLQEYQMLAKSMILIAAQNRQLAEARQGQKVAGNKAAAAKNATLPNSATAAPVGVGEQDDKSVLDAFERLSR